MLNVRDITAGYRGTAVLRSVNLQTREREFVTLVGPNGAGKTTLFRVISGFVAPSQGTVEFQGRTITHRPPHQLVRLGVGFVAEGRNVFSSLTVQENLHLAGRYGNVDSSDTDRTGEVFDVFPRLGERRDQLAGTLSGGEQQMLAIGRVLMTQPSFVLLDEPSLGLAPKLVTEIFRTLRELNERGMTILLIEQNARSALRVSDRGYVMENGRIAMEDEAASLLENPHVQNHYLGI